MKKLITAVLAVCPNCRTDMARLIDRPQPIGDVGLYHGSDQVVGTA